MRAGVFHAVCKQPDVEAAKREYMLIMCNLFGRRNLSKTFAQKKHIEMLQSKYPSMVVLPPLPEAAQNALIEHDVKILRIFEGYAHAFATKSAAEMGVDSDDVLPLSKIRYCGTDVDSSSEFRQHLKNNAIPVIVRSSFAANSGHGDSFTNVFELMQTSRSGINLNAHAIPSMTHLITASSSDEHMMNAYLLDFYIHGQVSTLAHANGVRRGDVWYLLQDFNLTLLTVKMALQQLLLKASKETVIAAEGAAETEDDDGFYDAREVDDDDDDDDDFNIKGSSSGSTSNKNSDFDRPARVRDADWRVYEIVSAVAHEFNEKFRKMWA